MLPKDKQIYVILILRKANGTPYGWAFLNFYHVRELIKRMYSHDGNITILGSADLKPFTNLTAKFIPRSNLTNYILVIHIDATKSGIKGSLPLRAHVPFANKIGQAVFSAKPNWK